MMAGSSVILRFDGQFKFLSNFFPTNQRMSDGIVYPTNEHYYQSQKLLHGSDIDTILIVKNPGKVKRLVRSMEQVPFDVWERRRLAVMWRGLLVKFRNEELAEKLIETRDCMLIEGNYWHDNFWGRCFCDKCRGRYGENRLGKMLMRIRRTKENEKY